MMPETPYKTTYQSPRRERVNAFTRRERPNPDVAESEWRYQEPSIHIIRSDVNIIKRDVDTLKDGFAELRHDVGGLKNDVADIKGELRAMNERIDKNLAEYKVIASDIQGEMRMNGRLHDPISSER
ncbi:MAG: hypothetical protein IJU98_04360 [Synergistaceae bacterium]|nr:hypothetical protein [Synergistaceae bacterium]